MEAPTKLDRLERVTDLVLVLLDTQQPLTLDAIAHQVPGYPSEHSARRQAFERDKRLLRDEGIPVLTQRLPGHEQYGYQIDREAFYLPELDLEPDEQIALHLAVAGVHLGDPSGRDALLKLGAAGLGDVRPIASMVPPAGAHRALRGGADARPPLRTPTGPRHAVSPRWACGSASGTGIWWPGTSNAAPCARSGWTGSKARCPAARPGSAEVPEDVDVEAALPDEPWEADGEDRVEMRIRVDALEARRVADEVGQDKVVHRLDDGSVELALEVSSFVAIRSWVLGLLDHATVIEPPAFRDELVAWLTALVAPVPALPADIRVPTPVAGERRRAHRTCTRRRPGPRPVGDCAGCWPWSAGWPRSGRLLSPTPRAGSA